MGGETDADGLQAARRARMCERQLRGRDIVDGAVLDAMASVPRDAFVPEAQRPYAYDDCALPIGHRQTISQPYIVALMSQLARVGRGARVLDVGTGCGYQAAVLAAMGAEVHSVEIDPALSERARMLLQELGYGVHCHVGDGYGGWPPGAPYDAILVAAAAPRVPPALLTQLAVGGRLIIPLGPTDAQVLTVLLAREGGVERIEGIPVRFVPMTGQVRESD